MAAEADSKRGDPSDAATADPASAGRRRLLRGGLGAAPVLMTLASDPVAAGVCKTASAFTSIATSGRTGTTATCGGRSPATWQSIATPPTNWPAAYPPTTKFADVFSPALTNANAKLGDVVSASTLPELAQHCTAALLNAAAGLVPASILSVATAKTLWSSISGSPGYYEPTAGVKWTAADAIAWIKTTYA